MRDWRSTLGSRLYSDPAMGLGEVQVWWKWPGYSGSSKIKCYLYFSADGRSYWLTKVAEVDWSAERLYSGFSWGGTLWVKWTVRSVQQNPGVVRQWSGVLRA